MDEDEDIRIVTVAPGKLGLTISNCNSSDDGNQNGGVIIKGILETCTLRDEVWIGDRIVSCDGKPVTTVHDLAGGNDKARQLGIVSSGNTTKSSSADNTSVAQSIGKRKASEISERVKVVGTSSRGRRTTMIHYREGNDEHNNDDDEPFTWTDEEEGTRLAQPSFCKAIEKCSSTQQLEFHESYLEYELKQVRRRLEFLKSRCNVHGCNNKAQGGGPHKGSCLRHGGKKLTGNKRHVCNIEGCTKIAKMSGGTCMKHTVEKPHYYYCIVEGCDKKRQGGQRGNMCGRHFTMHQNGTLGGETGATIMHDGDGEVDEQEAEETFYEEEQEEGVEEEYCGEH